MGGTRQITVSHLFVEWIKARGLILRSLDISLRSVRERTARRLTDNLLVLERTTLLVQDNLWGLQVTPPHLAACREPI